jgi:hypothetical protein
VVVLHILGKLTWRLVKALSSSHTLGVPIKESSIITDVVMGDHHRRGTHSSINTSWLLRCLNQMEYHSKSMTEAAMGIKIQKIPMLPNNGPTQPLPFEVVKYITRENTLPTKRFQAVLDENEITTLQKRKVVYAAML